MLATFLLVSYHVVGVNAKGGMQQDYPSFWRFFADALIDVRMPVFAFIAGAVYALRPLSLDDIPGFLKGKFRRLVVPGIVASAVFWIGCNLLLHDGFAYGADPVSVIMLSMGHFWFLQAILVIFVVIGGLDATLKYRAALPLFAGSLLLTFVWNNFPTPKIEYFQMSSAVYLTPYFLMGLLFFRHHHQIFQKAKTIAISALMMLLLGAALNYMIYQDSGQLSANRFDVQSISLGIGVIALSALFVPKLMFFDRIAIYSFTIYLYHPLGTSAVRRVMETAGLDGTIIHFCLGLMVGILLPCILHLFAERLEWTRFLLLGYNRASVRRPGEIKETA